MQDTGDRAISLGLTRVVLAAIAAGLLILVAGMLWFAPPVSASLLPSGWFPYLLVGEAAVLVGAGLVGRSMIDGIREQDETAVLRRYQTALIVMAALREAAGLVVVALAYLSGEPTWMVVGGGVAAVAVLTGMPHEETVRALLRRGGLGG
ncbi:MAG: hypothetical protein D6701_01415 [Gemmatimonadetes bacterium]|nr:MAG: hypothetical protein D6701_01415 [Gemmatimonadota bacterium]